MIFAVGDKSVETNNVRLGVKVNQFEHYANETLKLLDELGTGENKGEDLGPKDSETDFNNDAGFCFEVYRSRPILNRHGGTDSYSSRYIIALMGMTEEGLKAWAHSQHTDLLLDPNVCIKKGRELKFPLAVKTVLPEEYCDGVKGIHAEFWNYCYAEYRACPEKNELYQRYKTNPDSKTEKSSAEAFSIFSKMTRLRLIYEKLIAKKEIGGAGIPAECLVRDSNHPLLAIFPMHSPSQRKWLDDNWVKRWDLHSLLHPPIYDLRAYFNEPIAFYFSFMESYLSWLVPLSIFGTISFVGQLMLGGSQNGWMEVSIVFITV